MDERLIERIKEQPLNITAGMSFMVANPQDSLRRALQKMDAPGVGYGFALDVGYSFDPVPIVLGGQFAMNFYGGTDRDYIVPNQMGTSDTVSYSSQNSQIPITLNVRIQPNIGTWVFPYVEGVGGVMLFTSNLSMEQKNGVVINSDSRVESSASWLYGVGAGIMVKFADVITLPNTLQRFLVDVNMRYVKGTSVDIPVIKVLEPGPAFKIEKATVDEPTIIFFNVGITAQF